MITIIEDEKELLSLFTDLFGSLAYVTDCEKDFFKNVNDKKLAIVDLKSDKFNGLDIIKELNKNYSKVEVIVISGYLNKKYYEELSHLKINSIFSKPFNFEALQSYCLNLIK